MEKRSDWEKDQIEPKGLSFRQCKIKGKWRGRMGAGGTVGSVSETRLR